MKPTRLTIRGLNSFSEEQTIDFNALGEQGIFGIFGPTGSGKSTVLDAITFALYGRIAREAGAKTSADVINIHQKSARVVFEFDVNGKTQKSYKIIREIKRKEPSGILTTQIKIYDCTEGEIILAEKDKEFNAVIASIIGLEYDDFVKTVVLPQGGFNDFLKMEGKDRRIVLERLFNLEKYGEDLFRKISARYSDKNNEKIAVEGELKAYADLNEAVLKEEETALLALENQQKELRKQKDKDNSDTEKIKRQFDTQQELMQKRHALQAEQAKSAQFEVVKLQIENSRKYQLVEAQITEYKRLVQSGRSVANDLAKGQAEAEKTAEAQRGLAEKFQKLEEARNNHYPALLKRQSQLEAAIEGYKTYRQSLNAQKEIQASMKQSVQSLQNQEDTLNRLTQEKNLQAEALAGLKSQLESLQSGEHRKESLGKAIAVMGKIDVLKSHRISLENHATGLHCACNTLLAAAQAPSDKGQIDLLQIAGLQAAPSDAQGTSEKITHTKIEIEAIENALKKMEAELEALSAEDGADPKEILQRLAEADQKSEALSQEIKQKEQLVGDKDLQIEQTKTALTEIKIRQTKLETENEQNEKVLAKEKEAIEKLLGQLIDPSQELEKVGKQIQDILEKHEEVRKELSALEEKLRRLQTEVEVLRNSRNTLVEQVKEIQSALYEKLEALEIFKFSQVSAAERNKHLQEAIPVLEAWYLSKAAIEQKEAQITAHHKLLDEMSGMIQDLALKVGDTLLEKSVYEAIIENNRQINLDFEALTNQLMTKRAQYEANLKRFENVKSLSKRAGEISKALGLLSELRTLLGGRKFVEFMAINQLKYVTLEATKMLGDITGGGYSLEVDEYGTFKIRDNKNGGMLRNVKSLSGGETFLVSLSLALALSAQIQLKGVAPLELFFLDEGFGTLDDDLLDVVMEALESVQHDKLKIGLISHVEQLKQRIPVRLSVTPSKAGQGGSKVKIEYN